MERQEAVKFIQKETKRLREEEHIDDLFKANRSEELAAVECHTSKKFSDFLMKSDYELMLTDEEIAEGSCMATAMWGTSSYLNNAQLFTDVEHFAHRLAREAGDPGKNVAAQMLDGEELFDIPSEDFFSTKYAEEYDEKYGLGKF